MRITTLTRKTLAAGLAVCLAAMPFAQLTAQDAGAMQKSAAEQQTVPGKAADAWITTKVKSELATTKGIKSSDLSVTTTDGMVSITGTANSAMEKVKIEQVAKAVKGVKSVDTGGLTVSDAVK
ncbi:hyperosmotically inducible protein [Dyella sp. OK004]|uniref:BON domain-containing protein n=1 Tax=Dyella sp. OK004 TaxID=1855292 RepID=UPI0008E76147|nr:BON domain-containing protein [Dyella sp. OK004]SFS06538.1 hyperosmotically inducible protein [Dyella sp. OK004]